MRLTIVLRKEVPNIEQAQTLTNIVKQKLAEHPEIEITASASESLTLNQT